MTTPRAWRRVGLLAPASCIAAVAVALLLMVNATWASWASGVVAGATCVAGTWVAMEGLRPAWRAAASLGAFAVSAGVVALLFLVVWPAATPDGMIGPVVMPVMVLAPWVVLAAGSTVAVRTVPRAGAVSASRWWIGAIAVAALSVPASWWVISVTNADDLAMLALILAPAFALGLWSGPVAVTALVVRLTRVPAAAISGEGGAA